jgi:hypothetical protein
MTIIDQRFFRSNVSGFINLPLNGNTILTLESNISALQPTDSKSYRIVFRADSPSGNIVATSNVITMYGNAFLNIQAHGGTRTEEGNWIVHAFQESNTLNIASLSVFPERNTIQYLVVGGGGNPTPSTYSTAGGGAGGLLEGNISVTPSYIGNFTVQVGGAGGQTRLFDSAPIQITALAGGGGRAGGASGGGGQVFSVPGSSPGSAGTPGQGNPGFSGGGSASYGSRNPVTGAFWNQIVYNGGGGGGAGSGGPPLTSSKNGGAGLAISWVPTSYGAAGPAPGRWFSAGGFGSGYNYRSEGAPGGASTTYPAGNNGAGFGPANGSAGQQGIVIIRYPKG